MSGESIRRADGSLTEHVLDAAPDGVMVVEHGGRIVYANQPMHELTGASDSIVGRSVDEFVPDRVRGHHAQLRRRFERAPSPRPLGIGMDLTLRRVDGVEVPVDISLSPFDDADVGSGVIAAVRDVTERRRTDQRLAAAHEQLALVDERERIGRDLHDIVLQRLYGMGLHVQAISVGSPPATAERLEGVVDEIDRVISEVRTIVFTLGSGGGNGTLGQELADVIAQSSRLLGSTPHLRIDGPLESVLSDEARTEMIASMREALGNVARHAGATTVDVEILVGDGEVTMRVVDDGVGPPDEVGQPRHGNGLLNLRARASALGGECALSTGSTGGAVLSWSVPY